MKRLYKICILLSLLGGTLAAPAFAGHTYLQPASEPAAYRFDADITNNSLAISPNEHWAAASNSNQPRVRIIDLKNGDLRQELDGFVTPRNLLFTPDGKRLLISDSTLGIVAVVDTASWKQVSQVAVGAGAFGTAIDPKGQRVYVNNEAADTVTVIDLAMMRTIAVLTGFAEPRQGIKFSPDGRQVFVTNFKGDRITVIDSDTLEPNGEITGFDGIRAVSVSANGKTLYAANSKSNSIAVVDLEKRRITDNVPVGRDPYGAALSPNGTLVYSGDKVDNTLTVVDTTTRKVVGKVVGFDEPRQAITFTRDGRQAYVLNQDLSVAVVDLGALRIANTIGVRR